MKNAQDQANNNDDDFQLFARRTAHDINNILGAIQMYCDLIKRKTSDTQTVQECVLQIEKAANQGAEHARQLLSFRPADKRD